MATLLDRVQRFLGWDSSRPPREITTAVMGGDHQVSQAFPPAKAMSALVRHPYVWACGNRIAKDLARLPLIAIEPGPNGVADGKRVPLPDELRRKPNSAQSQREFRAQWVLNWAISGNGYIYRPTAPAYVRSSFLLLPGLTSIKYNDLGLPTGYRYNNRTDIALDEVGHVRGLSWQDTVQNLFGESPIRPLWDELDAAASAKMQAARGAKRGRAEWMLTPKDADGVFDPSSENGRKIVNAWEEQLIAGKGAIFIGDALEATQLSTSLRDMEYTTLQERADFAILSVFGVPPSMIGIPAANYGTSKQDARRYWENRQADAVAFDEVLTELYGIPGRLEIRHDFHGVEPLQVAKTEQIEQASRLVEMGAKPHRALEWCGLADPPMEPDTEPREQQMRPATAEEVDEPQGVRSLADLLAVSRAGYERAVSRGLPLDRRAADLEAMAPDLGIERAATVAEAVHAFVAGHLAECQRAGTEPYIRGLGCWSPAFADRLQRHLEAA